MYYLLLFWDVLVSSIYRLLGKKISKKLISYALVGFTGIGLQFLIIYILTEISNFKFEIILPIGVFVAACSNFSFNNILTFRSNKLEGKKFIFGLIKFLFLSSLPIIANVVACLLFYSAFSKNTFWAQLIGIFVNFIWNYLASSRLVWGKN